MMINVTSKIFYTYYPFQALESIIKENIQTLEKKITHTRTHVKRMFLSSNNFAWAEFMPPAPVSQVNRVGFGDTTTVVLARLAHVHWFMQQMSCAKTMCMTTLLEIYRKTWSKRDINVGTVWLLPCKTTQSIQQCPCYFNSPPASLKLQKSNKHSTVDSNPDLMLFLKSCYVIPKTWKFHVFPIANPCEASKLASILPTNVERGRQQPNSKEPQRKKTGASWTIWHIIWN